MHFARTAFALSLAFMLFAPAGRSTAADTAHAVPVTGCYSDLSYHEEAGDLNGTEITVPESANGRYVLYQSSEGVPNELYLVPAIVNGNNIQFNIASDNAPDALYSDSFNGTITPEGLYGTFTESGGRLALTRRPSYWAGPTAGPKVTGRYTSAEGPNGHRLFFLVHKEDFQLLYQARRNSQYKTPQLAPLTAKEDRISFCLPGNNTPSVRFNGTVTAGGVRGTFSNDDTLVFLRRDVD